MSSLCIFNEVAIRVLGRLDLSGVPERLFDLDGLLSGWDLFPTTNEALANLETTELYCMQQMREACPDHLRLIFSKELAHPTVTSLGVAMVRHMLARGDLATSYRYLGNLGARSLQSYMSETFFRYVELDLSLPNRYESNMLGRD